MSNSTKSPSNYQYRFVSAGGLERKHLNSAGGGGYGLGGQAGMLYAPPPNLWTAVKGEDFLSMGWEELEYVAHVIRDASVPTNGSMEPVTREMHSEVKKILSKRQDDALTTLDGKPLKPITPEAVKNAYDAARLGGATDYPHAIFWYLAASGYAPNPAASEREDSRKQASTPVDN